MGILRDAIGGGQGPGSSNGPPAAQAPPATELLAPGSAEAASTGGPAPPSAGPAGAAEGRSELRRRRDALAEQVTEMHWDLGGLAYEMAIRDHFRLDVLVRRAAMLQERDAELAEVERLLRMEEGAVAGTCPTCAAPHSRGALYCWQCGATLMERVPSSAIAAQQESVAVMDSLMPAAPSAGSDPAPASGE